MPVLGSIPDPGQRRYGKMEQTTEIANPIEVLEHNAVPVYRESVGQVPASEPVSVETQIVTCARLDFSLNVDVLKQFVSELSVLVDEAKIVFSVIDGLRSKVVDPAHIAMVDTGIALEMLETFDWMPKAVTVQEDGYVTEFGIDVDKVASYLKSLKLKDTMLKISVDFEKRKMKVDAPTGQRVMSLIDTTGMSDPKIPTLNLPFKIEVKDPKTFRGLIRQASEISDHIALSYDSVANAMWLDCESDMDRLHAQVDGDILETGYSTRERITPTGETERYQTKDCRSLFPLQYVADFVKAIPSTFTLEIGNDYPLKLQYGRTTYLLAPRIESGD
jgi:proliferating cell nuclear antigen